MRILNGVDLVDVGRIRHSMQRERFVQKVFSQAERDYFMQKAYPEQSAAGFFAAKEAFAKALGVGLSGFALADVEVLHNQDGCPYYSLHGKAAQLAGNSVLGLSISHTAEFAVAFAVMEPDEQFFQRREQLCLR